MLIVAGLDIGGAHGGAERFGLELSRRLDPAQFDVFLCAFWKRGGELESHWRQLLEDERIKVFFAADWKGKFDPREYIRGVRRIAQHGVPTPIDLIHSHFQMGTVATILLKTFGYSRTAVRTAHISLEWGEGLKAFVCRAVFQNWLYPLFLDAEIGVSEAIVNNLKGHWATRLLRKNPYLLSNAINPDAFNRAIQTPNDKQPSETEHTFIVGTVGRMTRQKGFVYLIQAVPKVLERVRHVRFVFIGDGELRDELKRCIRQLGVEEKVEFLGKQEDVLGWLEKMDLFVLPSLWEGLPTVMLESMACGVPVVGTDIPGIRELVQPGVTGWLVPPANSEALGEAIVSALESTSARMAVVSRAKEKARDYSIFAIAKKYESLYRHILD